MRSRWERATPAGALLASLAVLLSACGAAGGGPTSSSTAAATGSGALDLPPAETTDLTIGLSNDLAPNQWEDQFAVDLGLFKKYGLNVKVVSFEGDGKLLQAAVANQVEAGESSAGPAISSQVTDTPLVLTTANANGMPYLLMSAANIKTADDLKGKQVGVSSFGSLSHAVVLEALDQLGLSPDDVTIAQIGSESARIAALSAGSVSAVPVAASNTKPLIAQGLTPLVDLTKSKVQYIGSGLTVRKDWAGKNPNTVLRLIAAILEAQKAIWEQPDLAAQKYQEYTQVKTDVAKSTIEECINGTCNKGLTFTEEALKVPLEVTKSVNPNVAKVDLSKVYDLSYLEKLKSLGFNGAINFP